MSAFSPPGFIQADLWLCSNSVIICPGRVHHSSEDIAEWAEQSLSGIDHHLQLLNGADKGPSGMVYVKKWSEFQTQSLDLLARAPHKTRYLIKATPSQQWLVLKVTDDETCLKFRARSAIIINRFEAFSRSMTATMAGMPESAVGQAKALAADQPMDLDAVAGVTGKAGNASDGKPVAGSTQSAGAGGGAGKKKKKKGKK